MRRLIIFSLMLSFWNRAEVRAQTFGNVTMGGAGYVTGIIMSPSQTNLIYCKTDVGGAYRWEQTSSSWIPLLDWNSESETTYQGVESIAIDPQEPNKLYILAGTSYWNGGKTAILRSTDYGATFAITDVTSKFKAHGNGSDRQKGESLAVDPNKGSVLFCGSRANGLFKSLDSGVTWNAVASLNANLNIATDSISFVMFDKTTGTSNNVTPRIFVGVFRTGTNLFVSNDAGTNWVAVPGAPTNGLPQRCALAADNRLYITYGNGTSGSVMKYNTTNGTWFNCSPSGAKTYCGITVSATNAQKIIATTYNIYLQQPWNYGDRIYVSNNGGTNWTDLFGSSRISMDANGFPWIVDHAIHWAGTVEIDPFNSDRVFVGSGNGIFATTNLNSGATVSTWKFMVKGLEEEVASDFLSVPGGPFLTAIGDYGGFIHTDINVSPATGNMSQSSGFAYAAKKTNLIARIDTQGGMLVSKQFPVSFAAVPSPSGAMIGGKVAISADGNTILWKSTTNGVQACFYTTDFGTNWFASTGLNFSCNPVADPENPSKFYAYNSGNGFLYVSVNGGAAFSQSGQPGTGGNLTFRTVPGFEGNVWVARGGSGVRYSTNSGATFFNGNLTECDAIAFGKSAPGASYPTIFIWGRPGGVSVNGMYRSIDRGTTWVRVNDDAHEYGGRGNAGLIEGDKNVYGRVYMSTVGRGVPYMDSSVNVTNVIVSPATIFTFVTGTEQLTGSVLPANATYPSFTWTSGNPNVASVNASGLVTGNAAGTATVTATTFDGGFTASSVVTVTNLLTQPLLDFATSGGSSMTLSWPADHRGWFLQVQTNAFDTGLGTNWFNLAGSETTNSIVISPNASNASVFYRLVSP